MNPASRAGPFFISSSPRSDVVALSRDVLALPPDVVALSPDVVALSPDVVALSRCGRGAWLLPHER
jgi:hypothetical protein